MTPVELLDLPLPENPSGATTVRGYLIALLSRLWELEDRFSGKRPFGYSSWPNDLYRPMVAAGIVPGRLDEDGCLAEVDWRQADRMIEKAIAALGGENRP